MRPPACGRCGADLAAAPVTGVRKLQESEVVPPRVTGYQVQGRACGRGGAVSAGQPPAEITGRARYGPQAHARAANLAASSTSRSAGPRSSWVT